MKIRNALTVIIFATALAACGGGSGGDRAPGVEPGPPAPGGQVPPPPPVFPSDSIAADEIQATDTVATGMTGVSFSSPVTLTFSLIVNGSQRVTGLSSRTARFTLSRLEQEANGEHENWVSYISQSEDPVCRDQDDVDSNACTTFTTATDPAQVPDSAHVVQDPVAVGKEVRDQATYERSGVFTDNGDGTWSYTYTADPGTAANLDGVHRACIQFSLDAEVINPCIDFVPADLADPAIGEAATSLQPGFYDDYLTREVVTEGTCNTCHAKLAIHGGGRTATQYCVTCHNPGSIDANSDNSVDLKVMVHRIHYARELYSVNNGVPYKIWGFRNSEHDYSHVSYPQNVLNCTRCHAGQADADWMAEQGLGAPEASLTADGHNWAAKPSAAACGSCHEDPEAQDHIAGKEGCVGCHGDDARAPVREIHRNLIEETAARFEPRILDISSTAPGQFPQIRFSIVDPGSGDAPYDLQNDPAWTQGGGASRLAIDLAWSTKDYTNTGNGSEMASAVSINGLAADPLGNGEYLATSPVAVPDGSESPSIAATGSGAVGIEGHPAVDFAEEGDEEPNIVRIPMDNVVGYFSIDESSGKASARRDVVDMDNCRDCHRSLSLHGSNRNNEEQVCVLCHNPRNTDREVREIAANPPTDGKDEESLDFKTMVHAIHASGKRENPLQVVGFRGFNTHVYDEAHIQYPGELSNCQACHIGTSYALPLAESVLATTVDTGADHESPEDDLVDTPTASVCSSCHDSASAKRHMETTGGALFAAPIAEAEAAVESCDVCHGNDSSVGVNLVHPGLR